MWKVQGVVIADDKVNSPSDSLVVQGDSSGLLAELVTKECVEGVEDFPPLHLSSQKQRGRGRGIKADKSEKKGQYKTGLTGSKNKFDVLNGSGTEDPFDDESVPEARVTRVASLGVAALLQELKTKKKIFNFVIKLLIYSYFGHYAFKYLMTL
ncbi:hypothetical protein V6N11_047507 [Hibiscus sabdariffa]|uniref:Uncharacterized protein n=1 Tax=Hibiscus sabdariffa TaxID=183260 RepID=A0ABR2NKM4_9ROSI